MNNVGKMLVFLNLVFALLVGGFLVIDFQTRVNWKKAFEDLQKEMSVANSDAIQKRDSFEKSQQEVARLHKENLANLAEKRKAEATLRQTIVQESQAKNTAALASTKAETDRQVAVAENGRLQAEIEQIKKEKDELKGIIVALQKRNGEYLDLAQQAANERDSLRNRNDSLLERIREAEREKNRLLAPPKNGGVRSADAPNPPPFDIKGIITKVDSTTKNLVKISLGSDHGLQRGHTLEVFRTFPRPEYVGLIRLESVEPRHATARMIRTGIHGSNKIPRTKDDVASRLSRRTN